MTQDLKPSPHPRSIQGLREASPPGVPPARLSTGKAAARLSLSTEAFLRLAREHGIYGRRIAPKLVLWSVSDIDALWHRLPLTNRGAS